jgi:SM-20-related protein
MREYSNPVEDRIPIAAAALGDHGYALMADWITPELAQALRRDANSLSDSGQLTAAGTGDGVDNPGPRLRGDDTLWLDDPACGSAAGDLLSLLGILRVDLNHRLMLGLETIQAHYALYPTGASYSRHRDRFRHSDARVLSLVCYLNPEWPADAGGALRLHLADGAIDIAPRMGTVVIFLSDEIEHEVLPATQPRLSVAAWFSRRAHL